jgi:hypothetical protein
MISRKSILSDFDMFSEIRYSLRWKQNGASFLAWKLVARSDKIMSGAMFKFKISPNNGTRSVHYCTSLAMTIQPTTQVELNFVRVKFPLPETIFTHSMIS